MGNTQSYDGKKYDLVNQDDKELVTFNEDKPVIEKDGTKKWYNKDGKPHRDGDEPAVIRADGMREWWKNGKCHRDGDEPAVIGQGEKKWYKDGKLHRDGDEPAVIWPDGTSFWYKNGKLHRDGDKPAIIGKNGTLQWWNNGIEITNNEKNLLFKMLTRLDAIEYQLKTLTKAN